MNSSCVIIGLLVLLAASSLTEPALRAADCNGNGVQDVDDIASGGSGDCNGDETPDECETEPTFLSPFPFSFCDRRVSLDRFEPHSSALADFDGDGDLDLVTQDGEDRVGILYNDGDGLLEVGPEYFLEGADELISLATADIDGDGDQDVVLVDEATDNLLVLVNGGDGRFREGNERHDAGRQPSFLAVGQIDDDGIPDVVVADETGDDVAVFRGLGDERFEEMVRVEVGDQPLGLAIGDLDADGDGDIAVAVTSGRQLVVLFNDGSGGFDDVLALDATAGRPRHVAIADFDADGDADIATASQSGETLTLYRNDRDGVIVEAGVIELGQGPHSVIAFDLDGDGLQDLITGNEDDDTISVVLGLGEWEFRSARHFDVGRDPRFVVGGDLDGDGENELVVANHSTFDLSLLTFCPPRPEFPFRESICTERELLDVSVSTPYGGALELVARYLVPTVSGTGAAGPLVFNGAFESHVAFLREHFASSVEHLSDDELEALALRRGSRLWFTGEIHRVRVDDAATLGFTVSADFVADPEELPSVDEVEDVRDALATFVTLGELAYTPTYPRAKLDAAGWETPTFPLLLLTGPFRRGDVNDDGDVDVSDVISMLDHLFQDAAAPACPSAADANDDGVLDVSDAVRTLLGLFSGFELPAPSSGCGFDPTSDALENDETTCLAAACSAGTA